jgi:hypothetical protein
MIAALNKSELFKIDLKNDFKSFIEELPII